jgi:hypothetical protein
MVFDYTRFRMYCVVPFNLSKVRFLFAAFYNSPAAMVLTTFGRNYFFQIFYCKQGMLFAFPRLKKLKTGICASGYYQIDR